MKKIFAGMVNATAYYKADKLMRDQLEFERELIDLWTFNVAQDIHTGWPNDKAQKHVLDDNKKIEALKQAKPGLAYPASSQFSSFIESIESLQQSKRAGVDGYTFEQQE